MDNQKINIQVIARVTAVLYLLIAVIAPFSMLYMPSVLVSPGNPVETAEKFAASPSLLGAGMACDSVVFLIEIVITALLYVLVKPINSSLSLAAAFARLAMTVIQGKNLANYLFILMIIGVNGAPPAFSSQVLTAELILFFMNAHNQVAVVWGLFFGLHLLLLGYLIFQSGFLPKFVGIILMVTSTCYLIQGFAPFLFPAWKTVLDQIATISMIEIIFPIWLLIKGVDLEKWQIRVGA